MSIFTSIFINDEGTALELEFRDYEVVDGVFTDKQALDVSSASEITFNFKKPDGTTVTKTKTAAQVVFTNSGTDGKARYVTTSGFLDTKGKWMYNGFVELPTGKHSSLIVDFDVAQDL